MKQRFLTGIKQSWNTRFFKFSLLDEEWRWELVRGVVQLFVVRIQVLETFRSWLSIKHEINSPWKRSEKLNLQILQILYLSFNATVLDEESSPWQTFFLFLFMTKFHPLSPGPLQLQHGSASLSLLDLFVKLRLQLSVGVNWNDIVFNNNVKFSKSLRVLL